MKSQPQRLADGNQEVDFRAILDSAHDLIFILSPDARFLYSNRAFQSALGYSEQELRTLAIFDLLHPSCRKECGRLLQGLGHGEEVAALETEFVTKDGRSIRVEGHCSSESQNGRPGAIRGIFRDVTERERAQKALRESEERFRSLIEHSHDAISLFGPDGTVLYASPSTTNILGYLPEELRERDALEFVRPDWQDRVRDRFAESLRSPGVGIPTEGYVRHKDGRWRFLEGVLTNLLDNPSVGAIVNNYRDITERKQAEETLRDKEHLLSESQRIAHIGSWLYDPKGKEGMWSEEMYRICGVSPETFAPNAESFLNLIHPEDRPAMQEWTAACLAGKKPGEFEFRTILPDGTVRFVSAHGELKYATEKEPSYMTGTAQDITERKRAESALKENEFKFRAIIEASPVPYALNDEQQNITYLNAAFVKTFGYDLEDIPTLADWWPRAYPDAEYRQWVATTWQARLDKARQAGTPFEAIELNIRCKDGTLRTAIIDAVSLGETFKGVHLVVLYDITERKRAEEALRDREAQLGNLFEQASDGIYIISDENRYLDANARGLELLGYTRDELLRLGVADVLAPHEVARLAVEPVRMMAGVPHLAEWDHLRKDGSTFPGEVSARRLNDRSYLQIVRDLTARRQTEAALRAAERRLRELLENVDLIAVVLDVDGHVTFVNDFLLRLTGYHTDEVIGARWFEKFVPEQRPDVEQTFIDTLRTGTVPKHFENPIRTRNGDLRTIAWSNTVLFDSDGNAIGTASIGEDATARKLAEQAVRASEKRLRDLIDGLGPYMFVGLMTTDGTLIEANRPALAAASLKPEDVLGKPFDETYWWSYSEEVQLQLRAAIERAKQGQASRYDVQVRVAENQFIIIDFSLQPVRDETGNIVFLVPSANVITERKEAEESLRASSEQLRALSARLQSAREEEGTRIAREIHDELGGALTGLKWDLEGIEKVLSGAGGNGGVAMVREKIPGMTGLIESTISTVRRISSELRPGVLDDLGLVAAIEWQAQQFQSRTGIQCECIAGVHEIDVERERATAMFRIFQEILTNVIRHAQATRVDIELTDHDGLLELRVSDNGRGITAEEMRNPRSLGVLGMRERALLVGGEISISGVESKGTTVIARVPIR